MDPIPSLQLRHSQVPSSRSSLSCPSEPPDVGNWFSTYEYQSPDPDSNFSLEEGEKEANFERIKDRDEVVVREKLMQCSETCVNDDNHADMCLTKNKDSFSSSPLFSEPPDIRNWFSSYVYESSVSDTISPSKDEVSEEMKCEDGRFDFEVMNGDRSENVQPKGCAEHNSSSDKAMKGDGSSEMKKNSSTANTCHLEKILQQSVQDRTLQCNLGPTPTKYEETLNLNQGSLGCNEEAHLMPLDTNKSAIRPPKLVQKNDTREAKPKDEIQHDKIDMSARSSNCTANKENDGFVTTRRNSSTGANDENSWKKPEKISLQCSTNTRTAPLACEQRAAVTKRKALTEATNLQQSNAMEITGKWQCPQKRKPNTGPALKQLRLERWVHRV
ncbi:hypothetical protein SESBI_36377 [Sesbania bispinosa]|nr:hypothetical protein SESBI_36377 [Sesbania bispinosa]